MDTDDSHQVHGTEQIGSVTCPSGILVVLDGGCAGLWSDCRAPLISELPSTLGTVGGDGLDATPDALPVHVPHRQRVDELLETVGFGTVAFHGMSACVVTGMPQDRPLRIIGEQMAGADFRGCWKRVYIDIRAGDVAGSQAIGKVTVDMARLMAIDVDALDSWDDRASHDGKADVVFWGRDANAVAAEVGAGLVEPSCEVGSFGWLDLPLDEALNRSEYLESLRSRERGFAVDFRPHTHQWQVMSKVRASVSQSGVIEVAGTQATMFMTTWGDGHFPVEADYNADGEILRLRISLGFDDTD